MEVPRPSRSCSISRREFRLNEPFFSVLHSEDGLFIRKDIAVEHWTGPPENTFGWWKSTVKHVGDGISQQVSGETLQGLFDRLLSSPSEPDTLYILTLLLLRRKILRYEKEIQDEQGNRLLEVYSLQSNLTHQIPVAMPSQERLEEIQQQLSELNTE